MSFSNPLNRSLPAPFVLPLSEGEKRGGGAILHFRHLFCMTSRGIPFTSSIVGSGSEEGEEGGGEEREWGMLGSFSIISFWRGTQLNFIERVLTSESEKRRRGRRNGSSKWLPSLCQIPETPVRPGEEGRKGGKGKKE